MKWREMFDKYRPLKRDEKKHLATYRNQRIYSNKVHFPGFYKDYIVTALGVRIGVLLLKEKDVFLVSQYRYLPDDFSWEIPGGGVNEGETPDVAAIRECLEETGYRVNRLEPLVEFNLTLDCIDNYTHVFLCRDYEQVYDFQPNPQEIVQGRWIGLSDCINMIESGQIKDTMTMMALLYYKNTLSGLDHA